MKHFADCIHGLMVKLKLGAYLHWTALLDTYRASIRVPVVGCFHPLSWIGSVLGKLQVEQVDAILIVPKPCRY